MFDFDPNTFTLAVDVSDVNWWRTGLASWMILTLIQWIPCARWFYRTECVEFYRDRCSDPEATRQKNEWVDSVCAMALGFAMALCPFVLLLKPCLANVGRGICYVCKILVGVSKYAPPPK